MLTMTLTMIVIAPIMGVGGAIMAMRQDLHLSLLLLVLVPILASILGLLTFLATLLFQPMLRQLDGVNAILREQITGIRVIRAYLQQPREANLFGRANADLTDTATRAGRLGAMTMPSVTAMMQLGSVALIWYVSARFMPISWHRRTTHRERWFETSYSSGHCGGCPWTRLGDRRGKIA